MLVDSHAHFDMILENGGLTEDELLSSMESNGVDRAVQISIDLPSLRWSMDFIRRNPGGRYLFTAGIHPSSAADDETLASLVKAVDEIKKSPEGNLMFGIGECGLDYYRMRQPVESQRRSFRLQIDLAGVHGLPIVVHSRDAMEDTLSILKESGHGRGIIHCFPGDCAAARRFLDLGFYLSFAGNVTYKKASDMQEAAAYTPLDRILVETDAPFLTPEPLRGKKNRPEYIEHTYRFISRLKGISMEKLQQTVKENFLSLAGNAETEDYEK